MISDRSITVLFQGPREKEPKDPSVDITKACIERARQVFPGAHLVYSTWEGVPVDDLPIDEAVFSSDPGGFEFIHNDARTLNNSLRLIRSTKAGLARVVTPYVLRLRSDLFLYDRGFLAYFDKFKTFYSPLRVFQQRILIFSLWTRAFHATSAGKYERPFHISDWAHFGAVEDVRLLWSLPEPNEPELSQWYAQRPSFGLPLEKQRAWRLPPEQLLTEHLLSRLNLHAPEHSNDCSFESAMASRWFVATNFVVLDQLRWRMASLKIPFFQPSLPFAEYRGLYTFDIWHRDFQALCNGRPVFEFKHLHSDPHRILRAILRLLRMNEIRASRFYLKVMNWMYVR